MNTSSIVLIENTALVCEGAGVLYGFLAWTDTAEEEVTFYDGLEAGSGRKIINMGIDRYEPFAPNFTPGVSFDIGLYVVLSGNVKEVSIRFSESRKREAVPEFVPEKPAETLK